jgi:hypothetical protein
VANPSASTLQNILTAVLANANQDQNMQYPPSIYQAHFNTATSLLISALVKVYPSKPEIIDMLLPFVNVAPIPLSNGLIQLPDDYRNILGSPSIYVNAQASAECSGEVPTMTPQQFAVANLKGGCQRRPIRIVSQTEFDYLTTSSYKAPTYNDPIGFFTSAKSIKVCPYDLTKCFLLYTFQEPIFVYGYFLNPDDSYTFNLNTSIESTWGSNAFESLFKAVNNLYAIYARDKEMSDWAAILNERGIL